MKINLRSLFLGSCALVLGCNDPGAAEDSADTQGQAVQPVVAAVSLGATPIALNANGIPHMIRGSDAMPALPAATATESARQHLARLAPAWGLRSAAKLPQLDALGEIPVRGGTIVRFRQVIDGLPVEATSGGEVRVLVRPNGSMVATSGVVVSKDVSRAGADQFVDHDDSAAIARAVGATYKTTVSPQRLAHARTAADGSRVLSGQSDAINVSLSRAHKAWIPQGKALTPAWVVEAYSSNNSTDGDAYRTVVSASGKILSRTNLKADAVFKYRVYAEATGELHPFDGPEVDSSPNLNVPILFPSHRPFPAYQAPNLVSVDGTNHPGTAGTAADPWLAAGATFTKGNNVDAYTDATPPDGLSNGDFRADITSAGTFDRTYDFTKSAIASDDQQKFGIASLFYLINWMHDFWYDGGFVEAAGNGQTDNYGRGGEGGDATLAEAQDNARGPNGGSRDNANMATPSDGMPGKMQVFVWDNEDNRSLTANAVPYATGTAVFGPIKFDVTAEMIAAADGTGASSTDACEPLTAPATGKIVVVDRGACTFKTKTFNAQQAGAVGVIMANNAVGAAPGLADDATITTAITIPTLAVSQADGIVIKAAIGQGHTAALKRDLQPDLDGTLDITVIGHEYGHFVHHRLSSCNTALCGAMSEGWADFSALLVSSRAGDDFDKQFTMGIFSTRGTSTDPSFYGIRRAPYTTNHAVNALSFRHMAQGEALPGAPFDAGDPSVNNEVHNAGEVWTSMLWEGYAALQKAGGSDVTSFEATRLKMRQYVVAGLLMAPTDATPTETRDAILTAVRASSQADHDLLYAAYAKRGFGSCAESPARSSVAFTPIVESAELKGRIGVTGLALTEPTSCDKDDVLDPGEVLQIQIPITNPGPAKMTNVVATLHSDIVQVQGDATVSVGDLDAYNGQGMATFTVALKAAVARPTESDITLELSSDDGCGVVTVPVVTRFDTDDLLAASRDDDFNAGASAWKPTHVVNADGDTGELWTHERDSGLEALQFGEDSPVASDASLISPALTAGDDPVTISFEHAFLFESLNGGAANELPFDGGVIEYSLDATDDPTSGTWKDISELADPGYNRTLDGVPADTGNALSGRMAYGFVNDSFPDIDTVTLDLGTQLAGKTFRIRFRIGTDSGNGSDAAGWLIDNVKTTGLTNLPFPVLVADRNNCNPSTGTGDDKDDGGCCQTGSGMSTANLAAVLGVLGLVLRRRRKAAKA